MFGRSENHVFTEAEIREILSDYLWQIAHEIGAEMMELQKLYKADKNVDHILRLDGMAEAALIVQKHAELQEDLQENAE